MMGRVARTTSVEEDFKGGCETSHPSRHRARKIFVLEQHRKKMGEDVARALEDGFRHVSESEQDSGSVGTNYRGMIECKLP